MVIGNNNFGWYENEHTSYNANQWKIFFSIAMGNTNPFRPQGIYESAFNAKCLA